MFPVLDHHGDTPGIDLVGLALIDALLVLLSRSEGVEHHHLAAMVDREDVPGIAMTPGSLHGPDGPFRSGPEYARLREDACISDGDRLRDDAPLALRPRCSVDAAASRSFLFHHAKVTAWIPWRGENSACDKPLRSHRSNCGGQ